MARTHNAQFLTSDTQRRRSESLQLGSGPLVPDVARVENRCRLEEQDVRLLVGYRAVLHPARHDNELPLADPLVPVPELHPERAPHHQEELVLMLMVMPD